MALLDGGGASGEQSGHAYRFGSDYDVVWWVAADQPATVAAQLAGLGRKLEFPATANDQDSVAALFDLLQGRDRWLLIYDNAEQPEALTGLLPAAGGGHVLITSRWPAWVAHGSPVALNVWTRAESVRFLRVRTRHTDEQLLGEVADLVGDLPLAVEEAAAYLEQTGAAAGSASVRLCSSAAYRAPHGVFAQRGVGAWIMNSAALTVEVTSPPRPEPPVAPRRWTSTRVRHVKQRVLRLHPLGVQPPARLRLQPQRRGEHR